MVVDGQPREAAESVSCPVAATKRPHGGIRSMVTYGHGGVGGMHVPGCAARRLVWVRVRRFRRRIRASRTHC